MPPGQRVRVGDHRERGYTLIVRTPHPDQPELDVFVPLRFDRQVGAWVGITTTGKLLAFTTEHEALMASYANVLKHWASVRRLSRIVRLLCEHGEFSFTADGLDDDMLRDEARNLTLQTDTLNVMLTQLFNKPGDSTQVSLDRDAIVVVERQADE